MYDSKEMNQLKKLILGNSGLFVVSGRPSIGKTTFVINLVANILTQDQKSVLMFNLELSKEQTTERIVEAVAKIKDEKLEKGDLTNEDWETIVKSIAKLSESEIYIDDTPGISITELEGKCRKLKTEKKIELIVIDYIQLISAENENVLNIEQRNSQISLRLKRLSKELNIPILVCSMLSSRPDKRFHAGGDGRPILQDLLPSGALIQDADVIMFLYRDGYYKKEIQEKGETEVIIAKNRYGDCATIKFDIFG